MRRHVDEEGLVSPTGLTWQIEQALPMKLEKAANERQCGILHPAEREMLRAGILLFSGAFSLLRYQDRKSLDKLRHDTPVFSSVFFPPHS